MRILRRIVPALLVAFAVGCSSSESGGPTADGGLPTGDGGPGTDGGPGGDGGGGGTSPTCTVLGTNAIANEAKQLSNLEVTATSVVFLSVPDGAAPPASIEKMNLDGTGRMTLYTSTGDRRIHSMKVQGDVAYFFETDNAATIPVDELWSIPLAGAGGAPTRVGTVSFDGPRFFGSDAANLYVAYDSSTPAGVRFDRIVIASGMAENIAFLPDRGGANMASISGNDVLFWSAKTGADANVADIFRFDKTATAATPTALPGGVDALCDIRIAGMYSTPTKLACGFSGLNAFGHDGSGVSVLIPKDLLHSGPNVLVGADAETLYVFDREKSAKGVGTIVKISSAGGAVAPVACDLSPLQNRLLDASFPVQDEYEVTVGSTDVYWIEKRGIAPAAWFVRHAPK